MIWLNGGFTKEALWLARDRGFLLGDGVFETILVANHKPYWYERHLKRLRQSLGMIDISLPYSDESILQACLKLSRQYPAERKLALRLSVSRGLGGRGLEVESSSSPTVLLTAAPIPPTPRAITSRIVSILRPSTNLTSRIKSLSYLDNILARKEARLGGDEEAFLFNEKGRLSGAAAANLFIQHGSQIITPPVSEGALPGITRAILLEKERIGNLHMIEKELTPKMLEAADHVFITSSLIGAVPVSQINHQTKAVSPFMSMINDQLRF